MAAITSLVVEESETNQRICEGTREPPGPASTQLTQTLSACNPSLLSGWSSPFWICQCDRTSEPTPKGRERGLEMGPAPGAVRRQLTDRLGLTPTLAPSKHLPPHHIRSQAHPGQTPLRLRIPPFSGFLRELGLLGDRSRGGRRRGLKGKGLEEPDNWGLLWRATLHGSSTPLLQRCHLCHRAVEQGLTFQL